MGKVEWAKELPKMEVHPRSKNKYFFQKEAVIAFLIAFLVMICPIRMSIAGEGSSGSAAASLKVLPAMIRFERVGEQFPLIVKLEYANGTTLNVSDSSRVKYQSNNKDVAIVDDKR